MDRCSDDPFGEYSDEDIHDPFIEQFAKLGLRGKAKSTATAFILDHTTKRIVATTNGIAFDTSFTVKYDRCDPYFRVSVKAKDTSSILSVGGGETGKDLSVKAKSSNGLSVKFTAASFGRIKHPGPLHGGLKSNNMSTVTIVQSPQDTSNDIPETLGAIALSLDGIEKEENIPQFPKETQSFMQRQSRLGYRVLHIKICHNGHYALEGIFSKSTAWAAGVKKHLNLTTIELLVVSSRYLGDVSQSINDLSRWLVNTPRLLTWPGRDKAKNLLDTLEENKAIYGPLFADELRCTFDDMNHYATWHYLIFSKDYSILAHGIEEFEAKTKVVHLMKDVTRPAELVYYGFLNSAGVGQNSFHPRDGDVLNLKMIGNDKRTIAGTWKFHVDELSILNPGKYICGVVKCSEVLTSEAFQNLEKQLVLVNASASGNEIGTAINDKNEIACAVEYSCETAHSAMLDAFDDIARGPTESRKCSYSVAIRKVLPGVRIDKHMPHDFFRYAKEAGTLDDAQRFMSLNAMQTNVRENVQTGPILNMFQGPPGTGKTHTIIQMSLPVLLLQEGGLELICTSTNDGANDIATKLTLQTERLRKDKKLLQKYPHLGVPGGCVIIRMHNKTTEWDLAFNIQPEVKPREALYDKTSAETTSGKLNLSEVEQLVSEIIERSQNTTYMGVADKRVKLAHLSAGGRVLESVGLGRNPDGPGYLPAWPGFQVKHQAFIALVLQRAKLSAECDKLERMRQRGDISGEAATRLKHLTELLEKKRAQFADASKRIFEDVLCKAKVVVGTVVGVTDRYTIRILKDNVVAIMLDENARAKEFEAAPIFSTSFGRNPGILLVGDQKQLGPHLNHDDKHAVAQRHIGFSLMSRMEYIGLPFTMLEEQYRMHESIATIDSHLFYDGKLRTPAHLAHRPGTQEFATYARGIVKDTKLANNFMIDLASTHYEMSPYRISNSSVSKYHIQSRPSKSCEFHAIIGINTAAELSKIIKEVKERGTVGIITPYGGQKRIYEFMIDRMKQRSGDTYDNISVHTVDGVQGLEFDYAIVDIVLDEQIGFLRDARRINVMFSRAKLGQVTVMNTRALEACRAHGRSEQWQRNSREWTDPLNAMRQYYENSNSVDVRRVFTEFPKCDFYTPGESIKRRKEAQKTACGMRS